MKKGKYWIIGLIIVGLILAYFIYSPIVSINRSKVNCNVITDSTNLELMFHIAPDDSYDCCPPGVYRLRNSELAHQLLKFAKGTGGDMATAESKMFVIQKGKVIKEYEPYLDYNPGLQSSCSGYLERPVLCDFIDASDRVWSPIILE